MAFYTIQAHGYFVDYSGGQLHTTTYTHLFCGLHNVVGAWCPNCQKPLLRFLALDPVDPRVSLGQGPLPYLSLFFCWTCNVCQSNTLDAVEYATSPRMLGWMEVADVEKPWCLGGQTVEANAIWQYLAPFYYQFESDHSVVLLQYGKGGVEISFPYPDYPIYFPGAPARLVDIPDDSQLLLKLLNSHATDEWEALQNHPTLCRPRHQIAGEPLLVQRDTNYRMYCPICKAVMPFLASIGDDGVDPRGFTGNQYVQVLFHYCKSCRVVGAFQQSD